MSEPKNIVVIGAGYSSLSAACYLAKAGHEVHIYEKNTQIGGRSRQLKAQGFTFDMGPTWYWMPDVFERFFADFGKIPEDYYELKRTSPSYRVYFDEADYIDLPTEPLELMALFEKEEKGAGKALELFLKEAKDNYKIAVEDLVYKPGVSPLELVTLEIAKRLGLFMKSISKDVAARFKSDRLRRILEFPVLFLGAKPSNTPAFYNFMNYADLALGTWHPMGGMFNVARAMYDLALELGVHIHTDAPVEAIITNNKKATGLRINGEIISCDAIVSGADYVHTEQLLPEASRQYNADYWSKRTFAPSALLFYLGLSTPLDKVLHHSLFFDVGFEAHADAIYTNPHWPKDPLFYASFPSKTGYPMVDAGMRQLNQTGYMHNRVRMITAGFLCKHLLIDWRWGEAYFAKKLLDYDLSANNGNWQWAAGTGCDAAPYFRVFNPTSQQQKFDPNTAYIKRWVEDFDELSYPSPMVEHKAARLRALEVYKAGIADV